LQKLAAPPQNTLEEMGGEYANYFQFRIIRDVTYHTALLYATWLAVTIKYCANDTVKGLKFLQFLNPNFYNICILLQHLIFWCRRLQVYVLILNVYFLVVTDEFSRPGMR